MMWSIHEAKTHSIFPWKMWLLILAAPSYTSCPGKQVLDYVLALI